MGRLDGRVALVTGGGRGIGRSICELLAAEGATVAVNYRRDADAAAETVEAINAVRRLGEGVRRVGRRPLPMWRRWSTRSWPTSGTSICWCATRASLRADAPSPTPTRTRWNACVRVHAFGAHHASRLVLPSMRQRPRGDIVMISSVATTHMAANGAPYNMGKAALEALARTLAHEERQHGIHVNVVAPGLVETEMGVRLARAFTGNRDLVDLRSLDAAAPFGRVCQPADVAEVVLWLCTDGAGYVTGQRIEVDGGGTTR